jgi:hypothetical protein
MSNYKPIRINVPMRGHKAGAVIKIEVDSEGVPLDNFWRRRLKNADGCTYVIEPKKRDEE